MLLQTKGLALLQGDQTLDVMAERLDMSAKVIRNIESALRHKGIELSIKLSVNPSHDFELAGRKDGLALGQTQRKLAGILTEAGYVGDAHSGEGWAALLFDVWGIRLAVIWPQDKED